MPLLLHRIQHNLETLTADGCQLVEPNQELFRGLLIVTRGDPCTTGCCYYDGGKCPAFRKHHSIPLEEMARVSAEALRHMVKDDDGLIGGRWKGMTSKQIRAAEGGISPNEFQKRKQAGVYKS